MWYEITYSHTDEVWRWISNSSQTLQWIWLLFMLGLESNHVSKVAPGNVSCIKHAHPALLASGNRNCHFYIWYMSYCVIYTVWYILPLTMHCDAPCRSPWWQVNIVEVLASGQLRQRLGADWHQVKPQPILIKIYSVKMIDYKKDIIHIGWGTYAITLRHVSIMASQIAGNWTVCSTTRLDHHQRKHQLIA